MAEMTKYKAERILGLEGEYNSKALNKAYRKLAMRWHPDTAAAKGEDAKVAEAKMSEINSAKDYIEGIFRATNRITLTCDTAESEAAYDDDRFAEAVRNAQRTAERRAANARYQEERRAREAAQEQAREEYQRRAQERVSENWGTYGTRQDKQGYGFAEILKRLFSFDMVYRVLFLLFTLAMMTGATNEPSYLFWATAVLIGCVNMVFPLVTTPLRKVIIALLGLVSQKRKV